MRRRVLAASVFVPFAAAACGEGGSTELGSPPTAMIQVSAAADTVVTGEQTDPPISVRVEDALGNAVEGVPVRFEVTRGDGLVSPGVAVTSPDGVAESVFEAGTTPGEAEISVDIPSAPNVPALRFYVLAEASDSVLLGVVEGDGQRAETGSQLPLPFIVQARTPGGAPAGGVSIAFRLDRPDGVLTDATVLTDAAGRARTVLTLGREPREVRVRAFAGGGVFSDTVTLAATAVTQFDGSVALDSLGLDGLVSGTEATLHGRGFSPIPAENDVRIEGESAEVLTASGTRLTIRVPSFAGLCLPQREVGVRVLVGADASNGVLWTLEPAEPMLALEVGEARTVSAAAGDGCLQLPGGETAREYRLAVGDASPVSGTRTEIRLSTRIPAELGGTETGTDIEPTQVDRSLRDAAFARARPDLEIRNRALGELERTRALVSRGAGDDRAGIPVIGDTLSYTFALQADLSVSCTDSRSTVSGLVRAVGRHLVLVEDVAAPEGGFDAAEWTALGTELDRFVAPVDSAYFGPWADLDGNGRVVVLFTPEVNAVSDRLGGFFLPLDLAAREAGAGGGDACPASNEAEILYLAVADPDGRRGVVRTKDTALREARSLVAHQLQHLINAERRVLPSATGFAAIEDGWLDEGLAHLAEEIVGLSSLGLAPRGDYAFDQVANTREEFETFRTYQLDNFLALSLYLADPGDAPTLGGAGDDPVGSLQMRGFSWFLTRWLADQSGDQRAFLRSVVGGGQNVERGIANLERVTGRAWGELLADFAVTVAADDAGIEQLPARYRVATWDFRDVFTSLSQSTASQPLFPQAFPLRATRVPVETAVFEFDVRASSVHYFTLAPGAGAPPMSIGVRTPGTRARDEDTEPQITIVRTR